jgi:hypothetical protein
MVSLRCFFGILARKIEKILKDCLTGHISFDFGGAKRAGC